MNNLKTEKGLEIVKRDEQALCLLPHIHHPLHGDADEGSQGRVRLPPRPRDEEAADHQRTRREHRRHRLGCEGVQGGSPRDEDSGA